MEVIDLIITSVATETKRLRVLFGQEETYCLQREDSIDLHLKIPTLGQENTECLIYEPGYIYQNLGFYIIETADRLVGALVKEVSLPLLEQTYEIYLNFLELTKQWNLFRLWNYVPYINKETLGLENYKSFCKGRSLAFEAFYGKDFNVELPAASAVGIDDNKLVIYFIAGKERATHIENPEQVSAFHYPEQYGPRAPSFARGTLIFKDGKRIGYLSGTASIKGHQSVTLNDVTEQLYTTIDNMSLVFEQMGLICKRMSFGDSMPDYVKYDRAFKVYIRHEADAKHIQTLFSQSVLAAEEEQIIYLRTDICRSELDIEIEAIIKEN